jgi:phytoene/squalene synthetase
MKNTIPPHALAPFITKTASKQTYYTIRFLVDRERVADAYRAYAYFRWVDDTLDAGNLALSGLAPSRRAGVDEAPERIAFLARQQSLLEKCYRGEVFQGASLEEQMLVELVQRDQGKNSGLQSYLRNMMQVMEFDAKRRGKLISQAELYEYTRWLATAVTEAMHYFIGNKSYSPHDETRYLAVTGAHIVHMLRDTFDDMQAGYYNIPREVLEANHLQPQDIHSQAYRAWVQSRVQLARKCFQAGRGYLARVEEARCRLAGLAYTARFEWLLDTIEQENYCLRPEYTERKSLGTGLQMGLSTLSALINWRRAESLSQPFVSQLLRKL